MYFIPMFDDTSGYYDMASGVSYLNTNHEPGLNENSGGLIGAIWSMGFLGK